MKLKPQHAAAHVVGKLSAGHHQISEWHEPHGTIQHVADFDEENPGIIRHVHLGASGVQLIRGDIAVCIPLPVLFELAAEINPEFAAGPDVPLTPQLAQTLAEVPAAQ